MKNQVEEKFSGFFEKWVSQLEEYLQLLLNVSDDQVDHKTLVGKVTAHHKDYYTAKWAAAHEDVLAFFSPVWLSPLENAYLWNTGWKPSLMFQLVDTLRKAKVHSTRFANMTEEQMMKIAALRGKIRLEEEKVEREMERQQVAIADRGMVDLARVASRVQSRRDDTAAAAATQVDELVAVALKGLFDGLERVMKMADCVRLKALKGVLDVLSPIQCVEFLSAKLMLQIQTRKWGKKRESRRFENEKCASVL